VRNSILRIISTVLLIFPVALLAASEKPIIDGPLKHGASMVGAFAIPDHPTTFGLAQGSIFVAFGEHLGPQELTVGAVPYPTQLPSITGGTQVSFQSVESGQTFQAYLIHTSAGQIAGIIPSGIPFGFAEVRVSYNGMESEPTLVAIVESRIALFTVSQNGQGPGVVQNYESADSQPLNSLSRAAAPGQHLILWGTGLGAIEGPDNISPPVGNLRDDVVVRFRSVAGIVEVPADYAGRSPEFPGVDQINVRIPDDGSVGLGCYTRIEIQASNFSSRSVELAVSDTPGSCDHPWGLSAEKQAELDQGATATFLHLSPGSAGFSARFANADPVGIALNLGAPSRAYLMWADAPCGGISFIGTPVASPSTPVVVPLPPGLSAADPGRLFLVGPDLRAIQLERSSHDAVAFEPKMDPPDDFFIPGEWMLRSSGGKDVAPFETAFRIVPLPPLQFPESVSASADIEFTWDPEPYQAADHLRIFLREANEGQTSGWGVACAVRAAVGSLKISADELARMEAEIGSRLLWQMTLEVDPQTFTAPGLEHGQVTTGRSVTQEATVID
jgi:uncharacterized protein (TIGR03437 family)